MKHAPARLPFLRKIRLIALSLTLFTVSEFSYAIVDGTEAPLGDPYSAIFALEGSENRYCSGVLVAPTLILTAAHCVDGRMRVPTVANGKINQTGFRGAVASVERKKSHPLYVEDDSRDPKAARYDIGYVVLKEPVTSVKPAAVRVFSSHAEAITLPGKIATLTGYGFTTYAPDGKYNTAELGPKRYGEKTIVQATQNFISFDGPSQSMLPIDSGGPVFFDDGSGMKVIGLNHLFWENRDAGTYDHAIAHILTPESVCWAEKSSGIDIPGVDCP